jgi:RNA ligase (TIGR02306 family)
MPGTDLGWIYMCGSHSVRRKELCKREKVIKDSVTKEVLEKKTIETKSQFWDCLTDKVKDLLRFLSGYEDHDWADIKDVIVFGEMIGQGIQDLYYGTKFDFRVFDIMVDGKYVDFNEKMDYLTAFNVPHVPVLYTGPFSKQKLEEYVDGPTTMCSQEMAGKFGGREGIVITPVKERFDPNLKGDGRVILKAVSFAYLERHAGTEYH